MQKEIIENIQTNNKRIAKNTFYLYLRMVVLMVVGLYTSRVVLRVLGVNDFGIYNVVGGIVTMFSILSQSLSKSISRYITFELGKGHIIKLQEIFSTSVNIQFIIAFLIILIGEILGLWFVNYRMNISIERIHAANIALQFSLFNFGVNLISVPYNAAIVAHERMAAFAYISLIEAGLKLASVLLLSFLLVDKLVGWAVLQTLIALLIRSVYVHYCIRYFTETKYHFILRIDLLKEMFSFAAWNFIGSMGGVLRSQGVNMLLNVFFGTSVNAARGLAVQVNNNVAGFSNNFMMAVNPQITKQYANGQFTEAFNLCMLSSRFSFYLLLIVSLPFAFKIKYILTLWLNVVPSALPNFVVLTLMLTLIEVLSYPLITIQLATGNIRNYQLIVGGIHLMNFPISLLFLYLGYDADTTYYVAINIALLCLFVRLIMLKKIIQNVSIMSFVKNVIFKVVFVLIVSYVVAYYVNCNIINPFVSISLIAISTIFVVIFLGLKKKELHYIIGYFRKK